jgi:DNA-binding PadR family transcriptional regulator
MAECEMATDLVRCTALMLLYEHPCLHGYALMEMLRARLGRAVSPAIIYPFLRTLLQSGYLTSERESNGRRVKIIYTMTTEGRRFSRRVFGRLSAMVSTATVQSLTSCANCGCRIYGAAHREEIDGHRMTFCCIHCAAAYRQGE